MGSEGFRPAAGTEGREKGPHGQGIPGGKIGAAASGADGRGHRVAGFWEGARSDRRGGGRRRKVRRGPARFGASQNDSAEAAASREAGKTGPELFAQMERQEANRMHGPVASIFVCFATRIAGINRG